MSSTRNFLILGVILIGMFALAAFVRDQAAARIPPPDEGVLMTDHYRLSGTLDQPLLVVADTAALETSSSVFGDAALVGASGVQVDGQVQGDLTALGDMLTLGPEAQISGALAFMGDSAVINGAVEGDITIVADSLTLGPRARVSGEIAACVSQVDDQRQDAAAVQPCSESDLIPRFAALQSLATVGSGGFSSGGALISFASAFFLAGATALLAAIFPRRVALAAEAARQVPGRLAGLGCLTLLGLFSFSLLVLLLVALVPPLGLILMLITAFLLLLLFAALVMGWVALAAMAGDWLARRLGVHRAPPLITAAVGSLLLTLGLNLLALLPFGGLLALVGGLLVAFTGLGAVYRTRMGGRPLDDAYLLQAG